jgi:DNA recombination protein RmuC
LENSLDFILIFIPIDSALSLAQEEDTELFEYAFRKKVILTSPSTLLAALRAIENSWRIQNQAQNIKQVISDANNLYNKIRSFVEDFKKVGKALDNAQISYNSAFNKLTQGQGNVLKILENIKNRAEIKPKINIEDILNK